MGGITSFAFTVTRLDYGFLYCELTSNFPRDTHSPPIERLPAMTLATQQLIRRTRTPLQQHRRRQMETSQTISGSRSSTRVDLALRASVLQHKNLPNSIPTSRLSLQ